MYTVQTEDKRRVLRVQNIYRMCWILFFSPIYKMDGTDQFISDLYQFVSLFTKLCP